MNPLKRKPLINLEKAQTIKVNLGGAGKRGGNKKLIQGWIGRAFAKHHKTVLHCQLWISNGVTSLWTTIELFKIMIFTNLTKTQHHCSEPSMRRILKAVRPPAGMDGGKQVKGCVCSASCWWTRLVSGEAISRMICRPVPGKHLGYLAPIHAAKKRGQNHLIPRIYGMVTQFKNLCQLGFVVIWS